MPAHETSPVVRPFGKGHWRVYVTHNVRLHLVGTVQAVKILRPQRSVVYYAYDTRKKQLGSRYTLKSAVDLLVTQARRERKN